MVADIIGSSLIMQQDRHSDIDLYGTFQSILHTVIEKGGGFDIEFTGDDVSAGFPDSRSAVKTGFAIHQALDSWNSSVKGPVLAVRIGIHSGTPEDNARQRKLPLVVASRLQSLGSANALCVTGSVVDEIDPASSINVNYSGVYPLGLAPVSPVFYLLDGQSKFLASQRPMFELLRNKYTDTVKLAFTVPVLLSFIAVAAIYIFVSLETRIKNIEIAEVTNFNDDIHEQEIRSISTVLRKSLDAMPGINVVSSSGEPKSDFQLVCSYQQVAGKLRLTWGVLHHDGRVQITGGEITGKIENLASLQKQLVQNIISHLRKS